MDTITNNSLGWMSKAERAQVRAHSGLEWVFSEPRGLKSLKKAFLDAPEETTMLDLVYQRAAAGTAVLPRSAVNWRPWAVTAAAGFLVVLAMLLLPRVIDLTPQSAWAMVDGYILEYDLEFEEEYVASAAAAPEHPLNALIIAVHEWDEQHRAELGGESSPHASVDILSVHPQTPRPDRASLKVLLPGATEELRDDLTAKLAEFDGLSEPKVYSQRWYYQEKYPELFFEDHRLIIDGQAYQFPEDFSNDEIESLMMYFYHGAMGGGRIYVANLGIGKHHRFDLGEVVSIDANDAGDVEIATYADKLEFAPGEQPPDRKSWWVLIPPDEEDLDYDPVELLKRQVSADWRKRNEVNRPPIVPFGKSGMVIIANLLPPLRWLGTPPDQLVHELSRRDKEQAQALLTQVEETVSSWATGLPIDSTGNQPEWEVKPMGAGEAPAQVWVEIWTDEVGSDYRSYTSDLQQRIADISGTIPDSFNTREPMEFPAAGTTSYPPKIKDHYSFYYNLLPGGTEDLFDDEIPGLWSDEERQQAQETAERMNAAFDNWIQQHPQLLEEREMDRQWLSMLESNNLEVNKQYCYISTHERAGVLRSVMVSLYKDDPQLAAELEYALALPGVPEPEISRPGDPRNPPEMQDYFDNRAGYRIEWEMFSGAQISRCIALGRTPDAFTAEERANARAVLGAIRDRWREWLAEHPDIAALEYKGRSVHHAQSEHLAGVPTNFWIQLGVEDEDLLANVLAYLDVPGAPEPVVKNIREERETIEKRMQSEVQSYKPEPPVDGYQLIYYLYPQVETMYLTYEEAIASFGEEERERTAELAKELIDKFRMWKYALNLADDEAQAMVMVIADWPGPYPPDAIENDTAGILVTGIVLRLFVDSEELYEELEKSLAGFPVEPASGSGKAQLAKGFGTGDYVLVR